MNPSAQGWIEKFGSLDIHGNVAPNSEMKFYQDFRALGFIYGVNIKTIDHIPVPLLISEEEKAKINLLSALHQTYSRHRNASNDFNSFLEELLDFYQLLQSEQLSFFDRLMVGKKASSQLEFLLHQRISLNDNMITRNFSQMLTNSMLFTDVLNFSEYLAGERNLKANEQRLEQIILNLSYRVINAKANPSDYDQRLLQLLEVSSRYGQAHLQRNKGMDSYMTLIDRNEGSLENKYFFDLACLAALEDQGTWVIQEETLDELRETLHLPEEIATYSIEHATNFFTLHREHLPFLKDSNPFRALYHNAQFTVKKLILRNSRRLRKELGESKELLFLISQSAQRDLTPEERERLRSQLLDIFKTIPSLAIFALPGGAVLLPLFVKMIPSLLPSAFNDNYIEEDADPGIKP
ncbi:LETM1-related biofilm-associated protein [Robertkochia sediminum]|uniref:LETM1-related biofilm-associated protein n=1 Tax=Robertkochia sediminum TaxID=2785326 RepID=UPI001934757A|nr:LETM1-related biofilm-associated protein [Robertkochia sediminum]MBL7472604.1 hypothetical protein [Robertkochia sediminum]